MKKFAALGRADLLRCLDTPQGLDETTAQLLGYSRKVEEEPARRQPSPQGPEAGMSPGPAEPPAPEPEIEFPAERPRLQFLRPVRAETLQAEQPRRERGDPISDAELAADWSRTGPPLAPLARWARLAPFLRSRLGASLPGRRLDLRTLMRAAGTGLPLAVLPRLPRAAWAAQAVILWDASPEMFPFIADAQWLVKRLRRERGAHGLAVRVLKRLPERRDLAGIPAGVPVLALSAMGQFQGAEGTTEAWLALGRRMAFLGQPFYALTPCPRHRWQPAVASVWPSGVWDRRPRLPRHGGLHPLPHSVHDGRAVTGRLLDLLAPAFRIEPPLLRAARLRLGNEADAGTEWDAWYHAECWHALECFGFQPGDAYAARLERRLALGSDEAVLAREIDALARAQNQSCSAAIAAEAELRACLSGTSDVAAMVAAKTLLRRSVDRLRLLAEHPGSAEGRRSGLPAWFVGMVGRLTPGMRAEGDLRELIARGLAVAHAFIETPHTVLPDGVDGEYFVAETRAVAGRLAQPVDYRLELHGGAWQFAPASAVPAPEAMPLALLRVGSRPVHLTLPAPAGQRHRFQLSSPPGTVALPALAAPVPCMLESDRQRLHFEPAVRPAWAHRMWQDRFGLAAEFRIGAVPFILRWIPPGRFLMGSPEDEPGRYSDEGPRHEVTISRGFWMGETPVTQAQWRAVVEAARADAPLWKKLFKKDPLKPDPSHFKGPGELPVEQVSWVDSSAFCRLLDAVLPEGPGFRLPTEAQWEYACRAGTESALYSGGITIEGENHAPELDAIAWYGGNSGLDLEVSNPHDSADWPKKQYDHKKAGTHRVKLKAANPLGLHDTLGNVWEWCADAWDADAYSGRKDGVTDPEVKAASESAHRVVRGGSWRYQAQDCRAACRDRFGAGLRWFNRGFRLAAGQEPGAAEQWYDVKAVAWRLAAGQEPGAAEPLGAERPPGAEGRSRGGRTA